MSHFDEDEGNLLGQELLWHADGHPLITNHPGHCQWAMTQGRLQCDKSEPLLDLSLR